MPLRGRVCDVCVVGRHTLAGGQRLQCRDSRLKSLVPSASRTVPEMLLRFEIVPQVPYSKTLQDPFTLGIIGHFIKDT